MSTALAYDQQPPTVPLRILAAQTEVIPVLAAPARGLALLEAGEAACRFVCAPGPQLLALVVIVSIGVSAVLHHA